MKFFHFDQNNSFGNFKGPAKHVVVEAENATDANVRAEELGLYFDGVHTGSDCPCCGDRWYRLWVSEEGDDVPKVYGAAVVFDFVGDPYVLVLYANGEKRMGVEDPKY